MGDRSNIRFVQHETPEKKSSIWLYSHWSGCDIGGFLQTALKCPQVAARYGDETYCTRSTIQHILMNHASDADEKVQETGWGLSTYRTDNEHPFFEVDYEAKTVSLKSDDGWHERFDADKAKVLKSWSFQEFCTLEVDDWRDLCYPKSE